MKRAYNQKVLLCYQTLFTYDLGKGEAASVSRILHHMKQLAYCCCQLLQRRLLNWTKPLPPSLALGTITDLSRGKAELLAENALLRQQLIVLRRQIKRPACTTTDRLLLVLLARAVRTWRQALYIVQPETLLRWHRQAFRVWWKRKSKALSPRPKISPEVITLIREMAKHNRLWGAQSIQSYSWRVAQARYSCLNRPSRSS